MPDRNSSAQTASIGRSEGGHRRERQTDKETGLTYTRTAREPGPDPIPQVLKFDISSKDAREVLKVSRETLDMYIKLGKLIRGIHFIKIGGETGRIYYNELTMRHFLATQHDTKSHAEFLQEVSRQMAAKALATLLTKTPVTKQQK